MKRPNTNTPSLLVTCGFPGAGKSTWARQQHDFVTLSADGIREHDARAGALFAQLYEELRALVECGRSVIWDACCLRERDRTAPRGVLRDLNVHFELVVFATPWHVCRERDEARGARASTVNWHNARRDMSKMLQDVHHEHWQNVHWVPAPATAAQFVWCEP